MKANLLASWMLLLLLAACGQHQSPTETASPAIRPPAAAPATPSAVAAAPAAPTPPERFVAAHLYYAFAAASDTVLHLSGHSYRLSWRVRLDTLRPLIHITPPNPAHHFPGDTSRGFQGYYALMVRDSLGHRVGGHTFTKPDFYPAVGPGLAISSEVELPKLLGYSEPLGGLVFTVPFNVPDTDWGGNAVLLLTLGGQVRLLTDGYSIGGPDVQPTLADDGRTLLTGSQVVRAMGAALPLLRPGTELRAALLLNDSLAVAIYQGSARRPSQPNTFVFNTHSGQRVGRFRYDGFWEELGVTVPWQYLTATHTGYFLDDKRGLYLLRAAVPESVAFRSIKSLLPFRPPAKLSEKQLDLAGYFRHYQLYIDTLDASRIRYQYEQTTSEE